MAEPSLLEALLRVKKELASVGLIVAAVGGGGWFQLDQQDIAEDKLVIQLYEADIGRLRMRVADQQTQLDNQRKICLGLVEAERENTAQWRAQCGG